MSSGDLSDGKKQELLKEMKIKGGERLYEREYGRFPFPLYCSWAETSQPCAQMPAEVTPKPASVHTASSNYDDDDALSDYEKALRDLEEALSDFEEYLFVKDHNPLK